jgi:hypothetical protein
MIRPIFSLTIYPVLDEDQISGGSSPQGPASAIRVKWRPPDSAPATRGVNLSSITLCTSPIWSCDDGNEESTPIPRIRVDIPTNGSSAFVVGSSTGSGTVGFLPPTRLLHTGNGETTTGMTFRPAASSPKRCKIGSPSQGRRQHPRRRSPLALARYKSG